MKIITLEQLKKLNACASQLKKFEEFFGQSVTLSSELVKYAGDFDWNWAAYNLLPKTAWVEWERVIDEAIVEYDCVRVPAWAEYERVTAPAKAEYLRVEAAAVTECERVKAAAWVEYKRVIAPAEAEYDRIRHAAWTEYQRVAAETFLRLAMQEN